MQITLKDRAAVSQSEAVNLGMKLIFNLSYYPVLSSISEGIGWFLSSCFLFLTRGQLVFFF